MLTILMVFFVFLSMPYKMFLFTENFCVDIELPNLHAQFMFISLLHFETLFMRLL
jgi:hypothetical protein